MHIYIDESGSFVPAQNPDSWCIVAAYMTPDSQIRKLKRCLVTLKRRAGRGFHEEVKLKHVTESQYIHFLKCIKSLPGRMFAVATNMSVIGEQEIVAHQIEQADRVVIYIDRMRYEEARRGLRNLSNKIRSISPQLYVQLVCQIMLLHDVINRGVLYFVQRKPKFLRSFKWRLDQKNTTKTVFEDAFQGIAPGLLQSISIEDPGIFCDEFDYSAMSKFIYSADSAPTYLAEEYGIELSDAPKLDISKMLRDDFQFVDSSETIGTQVVDLIASGLRRVLRNDFERNGEISRLLGSLMVSNVRGKSCLQLISFRHGSVENPDTEGAIRLLDSAASFILVKNQNTHDLPG